MFSRLLIALGVLVMIMLAWQAAVDDKSHRASMDSSKGSSPRLLTTRFSYKATVSEMPAGTQVLDLWLPVPSNGEWQTVTDIKVAGADRYKLTQEKEYGNRMVYIRAENPQTPVTVTVQFLVKREEVQVLGNSSGNGNKGSGNNGKQWRYFLKPSARVPVGGRFGEIAQEVTRGKASHIDKARALFEYIVATMQYDYKKESPEYGEGDVPFVCDYKKGDCSDLHSYFISLARSIGIPSVLEYGFPLSGIPLPDPLLKEGKIGGYHCWAWIYEPTVGWLPLDASDARRWLDANRQEIKEYLFGNLVLERSVVAFSRGRDITLEPPQKGGPLNNFIYPYAEADGKAVKAGWELNYRFISNGGNGGSPVQ